MADDNDIEDGFDDVPVAELKKLSLGNADPAAAKKVADLKAKVEANPNDADLQAQLAQAYFNQEEDEAALEAYTKAIQLNPGKAAFYQQKAQVCLYGSHTDEALQLLKKALELEPTNASILFDLGKACQQDEDHKEAEKYFRAAVQHQPTHAKALYQVATYVLNSDDAKSHAARQEESLKLFKQVISIDANYTNAYYNAGQILQNLCRSKDDIKEAAALFSKAISLDPTDAQLRAKLVQCYDYLDQDAEREAVRAQLHADYKKGVLNPNYTKVGRYCCAQFEVGTKYVMAFDHFTFEGKQPVKYVFMVYNKGEVHEAKVLFRVSLGSYDDAQKPNAATRTYHLDLYHPTSHTRLAEYEGEPAFKLVKEAVINAVKSA